MTVGRMQNDGSIACDLEEMGVSWAPRLEVVIMMMTELASI